MTTFIQLHLLTAYAPANLNRDDLGRPKTAKMGGFDRLRISSQSLKRVWRKSDLFEHALANHIGSRTRRLGRKIYDQLMELRVDEKLAFTIAEKIAQQFAKLRTEKKPKDPLTNLESEQMVHLSHLELASVTKLTTILAAEKRAPTNDELALFRKDNTSVDIALFGRMLASTPNFNVEAACQVAHAIGVSAVTIEDDFFTAIDDIDSKKQDQGAAHMGEQGFASALFYTYICISRDLLLDNLNGDEALVARTIRALTEVAVKISPKGKQNSFASHAYASYILAERGTQQPRSLAVAYFTPIRGGDQLTTAVANLESQQVKFDQVYGQCAEQRYVMNAETSTGSLTELLDFVSKA